MTKTIYQVLMFCALLVPAAAFAQTGKETIAKQAFMIDYDTGTVLLEKNADEKMPTSSMSKTMTLYMIFEAIKNGRLQLDSELPVSEKAWRMQGSKMFVELGKGVSVEDLIRGVAIQSGNDATIVLAEGLSGSEEAFAQAMNARAKELGMTNSHFMNASGWPDPDHYSTARDLATLAKHLITDFPEDYKYFAEKEFVWHNIKQGNRNPLLYRNIGADGIKTGHAEEAGYGLMASGTAGGRRVILVLNGMPDMQARADESARLLDWGLRGFENVSLFDPQEPVANVPVVMGAADAVPLVLDEKLAITLPEGTRGGLKVSAVYDTPLKAPVKKGAVVGKLQVEIPLGQTVEYPLLAGADVEPLGFFAATAEKAKLMLTGGL